MFSIDHPKLRITLGTVSSSMVWDPESRLCLILVYLDPASLISAPKREGRLVSTNIWLGQGTLEEKIKEQKNNTQVRKYTFQENKTNVLHEEIALLRVSHNFSRMCSEVCSEFSKFTTNLAISLRTCQSNCELGNKVVNFTPNFVGKLTSSLQEKFAPFGEIVSEFP